MRLANVTREEQVVGGLAILLAIALIALPWFSIGGGSIGGISIPSYDLSATDGPDGFAGVLAFIGFCSYDHRRPGPFVLQATSRSPVAGDVRWLRASCSAS